MCICPSVLDLFIQMGLSSKDAGSVLVIMMVFLGAFLTGLGIYNNIGKFAGAGSIIPITGFANSIVSSAMEWKREGHIYGIAAEMFTIAGPVLVYGITASIIIGLVFALK